jgi:hypothetical protein
MKTLWVLITVSTLHQNVSDAFLPTFDEYLDCAAEECRLMNLEVGRTMGTDDPKRSEVLFRPLANYECRKIEINDGDS